MMEGRRLLLHPREMWLDITIRSGYKILTKSLNSTLPALMVIRGVVSGKSLGHSFSLCLVGSTASRKWYSKRRFFKVWCVYKLCGWYTTICVLCLAGKFFVSSSLCYHHLNLETLWIYKFLFLSGNWYIVLV